MKLPDCEKAEVPVEKISGYLLSGNHPVGRFKACFFQSLGYDIKDGGLLARDLISFACNNDVSMISKTVFGVKYIIAGKLTGPNGRASLIKSIWIHGSEKKYPRFVTAYPL